MENIDVVRHEIHHHYDKNEESEFSKKKEEKTKEIATCFIELYQGLQAIYLEVENLTNSYLMPTN
jgi:hypothetical protein